MISELSKWADVFVLAPADALTISKLARGNCDNLLTCALLAWPAEDKPLVVCPSMNTKMWAHPATRENVRLVRRYGAHVVGPISKVLVCGDVGEGAMQEPGQIAASVGEIVSDLADGRRWNGSSKAVVVFCGAVAVLVLAALTHRRFA